MRTENLRPTRLLRVRELTERVAKQPVARKDGGKKSRFVAPYYLQAEAQEAITACLQETGAGDDEGRQLFLTAAEYEVGAYRLNHKDAPAPKPATAARPKPKSKTKAETELESLRASVHQLLGTLGQTRKTARNALGEALTASDPFGRVHDERYLSLLEHELNRLVGACGASAEAAEPASPEPPPVSDQAKKLIGQLARIYRECLEVGLNPEELGTFCRVLCIIRDAAEIDIPCQVEVVESLLQEATGK